MKKNLFFFMLIFTIANLQAQDYQISFAGNGASTTVETVQVQNLTQGTSLTLSGSDVLHLTGTTGIKTTTISNKPLRIYPNPMIINSNIEFEVTKTGIVTVGLFDITGKKITSTENNLQAGVHKFNLSGLNSGVYTLRVESDNDNYSGKIVSNCKVAGITTIKYANSTENSVEITTDYTIGTLRSAQTTVDMPFTTGDIIELTAISGNYSTMRTFIPVSNSTETFNFVAATDYDGNNYTTVDIGTQTWMSENLKTTKYADGTTIPPYLMKVCNNDSSTISKLGYLYTWDALMNNSTVSGFQGACPNGWHVPTIVEYNTLINYLGGSAIAGRKMKSTDTNYWDDVTKSDNASGFSALAGGWIMSGMSFWYKGATMFWTSTEDGTNAKIIQLNGNSEGAVNLYGSSKSTLISCRCIKD